MKKKHFFKYIAGAITFLLIIATGIIFKQNPLLTLPLIISLVVMLYQADVNRYGYLIGGLNSLLYGAVYIYLGLYASAANAILISFTTQIVTFLNWKKKAYKQAVVFKKMNVKKWILFAIMFLISWICVFKVLLNGGSQYAVLDCSTSVLGLFVSILMMFAYVEYAGLCVVSGISNILLNIQLVMDNPQQMTYLIFSLYSLFCYILGNINAKKIYIEQNCKNKCF